LNPNYNTDKTAFSSDDSDASLTGNGISTYNTPGGFQMSIDFQSFMGKKRDDFTKEGTGARLELGATNKFSRGVIIKGNVILLDDKAKTKDIKDILINLYGIERAVAQGLQRITTIEKYESKIKIQRNDLNITTDTISDSDNSYATFPFEIQIPYNANVSYIGKYSEYYWGLEAKINVPWSSDIYVRSIVEVVY
jgi:Arrestin (or S-antigen), N-terminal domain